MNYDSILKLASKFAKITKEAAKNPADMSVDELKNEMGILTKQFGVQASNPSTPVGKRWLALNTELKKKQQASTAQEQEKVQQSNVPVQNVINGGIMKANKIIAAVESYLYNLGLPKNSVTWNVTVNPDKTAYFTFEGASEDVAAKANKISAKLLTYIADNVQDLDVPTAVTSNVAKLPTAQK